MHLFFNNTTSFSSCICHWLQCNFPLPSLFYNPSLLPYRLLSDYSHCFNNSILKMLKSILQPPGLIQVSVPIYERGLIAMFVIGRDHVTPQKWIQAQQQTSPCQAAGRDLNRPSPFPEVPMVAQRGTLDSRLGTTMLSFQGNPEGSVPCLPPPI